MAVKTFWESTADELDRLDVDVLLAVMGNNHQKYDTDTGLLVD